MSGRPPDSTDTWTRQGPQTNLITPLSHVFERDLRVNLHTLKRDSAVIRELLLLTEAIFEPFILKKMCLLF